MLAWLMNMGFAGGTAPVASTDPGPAFYRRAVSIAHCLVMLLGR